MKLCVITCYKQPDYVRARSLRAAGRLIDDADVITVKNTHTGILRYLEVILRTIVVRIRLRPDVYLLTFRGYEMLLPVRIVTIGRPLIYDEFIHPIEWAIYEHKKLSPGNVVVKLFQFFYRILLSSVQLVITDTASHAELSAKLTRLSKKKIMPIAVGTDDLVFAEPAKLGTSGKEFTVFYYGNMLPLHGLEYVIEAAVKLKHEPVKFVLIGGSQTTADDVALAQAGGANIEYKKWVKFEQLPGLMNSADLCLAGPFGGTYQAQYVITGKAYQYLAMGRPTVVGSNKESHIFSDKHDALVVPQKDSRALAEAIRWAMEHRAELKKLGKAGRELYKQQFSTEELAVRLKEILATIS